MKRQYLVDMVLNAYTLQECLLAERVLIRWLSHHPEDLGLHELAGQLGIVQAAAQERQLQAPISQASLPSLSISGH